MENKRTVMKKIERKADCAVLQVQRGIHTLLQRAYQKEDGIDGILVTVGLCIIALLLCVVMKSSLTDFIEDIVESMKTKSTNILNGV